MAVSGGNVRKKGQVCQATRMAGSKRVFQGYTRTSFGGMKARVVSARDKAKGEGGFNA